MLILRPTQKLAKRLHCTIAPTAESSTTRLGDWYANLYYMGTIPFVLCISAESRLPVLVAAKDLNNFARRFQSALRALLRTIVVVDPLIDAELAAMQPMIYAKSEDRSLIGTMNDFGEMLNYHEFDPFDANQCYQLALHLAEGGAARFGMRSPIEATQTLFTIPAAEMSAWS